MLTRRQFSFLPLLAAAQSAPQMNSRERVRRALQGEEVDRVPFTFWHHFGLQSFPGERHARATLDFHRRFRTDLVKVMSDFPYPRPSGDWYRLSAEENPYPQQIRALQLIRDGLGGEAPFVETIFNPWNVAEKLSSPKDVLRLKAERPQALLDALEVIAKSEAQHARRAVAAGASGIFLAVANAQDTILTRSDYEKFSQPFDKMILEVVSSAPLNILHLHGDGVYFEPFYKGWAASAINYSIHGTGVSVAEVRKNFSGLLLCGIDERNYRTLTPTLMKGQWQIAQREAGRRFLLAPGCSVPNDSTDEELLRLTNVVGA
jgi:uroporphyrinogen decarboxylase